jgi:hypothetical protein
MTSESPLQQRQPKAMAQVEGLNGTRIRFTHQEGYLVEVRAEVDGAGAPMLIPVNGPALRAALEAVLHAC